MEIKQFEIRDRMTFISALGILVDGLDGKLLRRAGYNEPLVILMNLNGCEAHYNPHHWRGDTRTMPNAHKYIQEHWRELKSCQVIDVSYILGEVEQPCESEVV